MRGSVAGDDRVVKNRGFGQTDLNATALLIVLVDLQIFRSNGTSNRSSCACQFTNRNIINLFGNQTSKCNKLKPLVSSGRGKRDISRQSVRPH
jgi:hypothetical protein